jgi:hypothetical protein
VCAKSFLCGFDKLTGQNFDHRRGWIVERMNELAQIYAVRVLAFSAMSNHMHLALQFDPAWVEAWTDQEVAERWNRLFPKAKMTEAQQAVRIQAWLAQDGKIANMRERLASVSEFMKYLSQPIALRANIEDDCKGKFWESRFKCQRLLDEAAVLSAMVYVDLNPVRAAMAQDLEDSDYTSIQQRIRETARKLGKRRRSARSRRRRPRHRLAADQHRPVPQPGRLDRSADASRQARQDRSRAAADPRSPRPDRSQLDHPGQGDRERLLPRHRRGRDHRLREAGRSALVSGAWRGARALQDEIETGLTGPETPRKPRQPIGWRAGVVSRRFFPGSFCRRLHHGPAASSPVAPLEISGLRQSTASCPRPNVASASSSASPRLLQLSTRISTPLVGRLT